VGGGGWTFVEFIVMTMLYVAHSNQMQIMKKKKSEAQKMQEPHAHSEKFGVKGISELLFLQPLVAVIGSLVVVVGIPADLLQVLIVEPGEAILVALPHLGVLTITTPPCGCRGTKRGCHT
jgi:hypothetical protein